MIADVKKFITDYRTTAQFLLTGSIGVLVDNGALFFLYDFLGANLVVSKAFATEAAIITNFLINDNWTFEMESQPGTKLDRLLKSNTIRLLGLAASVVTLVILHEQVGMHLFLANIVSIGVGFIFNYILESYAWGMHRE